MKRLLLLAVCLAAPWSQTAGAATIHLVETGWTLGGPLTVDGTGTDGDADDVLALAELTSLTAIYEIAGGGTLTWDLGDFLLGAFGIGPLGDTYLFLAQNPGGAAVVASAGGGSSSAQVSDPAIPLSDSASTVAQVPEPGSLFLTAGAVLAAAVLVRIRTGRSVGPRRSSR